MGIEDKKHIVAITAVIKNRTQDKFLIVKRHKNEIAYPGKWAFPGGKAEKGEDILKTLKREVLEEVGIEIEDYKRFLRDYTFVRPDGHNVIGLCFEVLAKSEDVIISKDFENFRWVAPREFDSFDYDHIEGMEKEIKKAFEDN